MDNVNEKATFPKDDIFHRVDFAKKAMALIKSHPENRGACVISIDAPWGMGKSTFLRMWMNELDRYNGENEFYQAPLFEQHKNLCVYYNAWENDYYDNALLPLLYTICGCISVEKRKTDDWEEKKTSKLKNLIGAGAGILGFVSCAHATQNPGLATMVGGLASATADALLHMFEKKELTAITEQYEKDRKNRQEFQNAISELAELAGKLYIFVDELDRCKPLFAIQTLECIKHFFNIKNVVFVFATDICQLAYSVAGVYGQGINAGGYLSKFFDYQLHLPAPNVYDIMKYSYPQISIDRDYYGILNEIIHSIGLTPREMPLIIKQVNTLWSIYNLNSEGFYPSFVVPYLTLFLGMKYRLPDIYQSFFAGSMEWKNHVSKASSQTAYEMLEYTFTNLQIDKEKGSEITRWDQIYETALRTRKAKDSIDFNLPHLFAYFSRHTLNEMRSLREVLQTIFEIPAVD